MNILYFYVTNFIMLIMKHLLRLSIFFILFGIWVSCEKKEHENQPPLINSISNIQIIKSGESIEFTCDAVDPEGSALSYLWHSEHGSFPNGVTTKTTTWIAPNEPGNYYIKLTVSDGELETLKEKSVSVQENPILYISETDIVLTSTDTKKLIELKNIGSGSVDWSIEENIPWLSVGKQYENFPNDNIVIGNITTTDTLFLYIHYSEVTPDNTAGNFKLITNIGDYNFSIELEYDWMIDQRDQRTYRIVNIGEQWWMAENLAYLPEVHLTDDLSNQVARYYVYNYNGNDIEEAKKTEEFDDFGALYNWLAAGTSCPSGWHLPFSSDWDKLASYVDSQFGPYNVEGENWENLGIHLKSRNSWSWTNGSPKVYGTDDYGFTGVDARYNDSFYFHSGSRWWVASIRSEETAIERGLTNRSQIFYQSWDYFERGLSVRCIKD